MEHVKYGDLNIGDEFKFEQSSVYWNKKIKLGRKIVYIRLDGHFSYHPPVGAKNNLLVYPKNTSKSQQSTTINN